MNYRRNRNNLKSVIWRILIVGWVLFALGGQGSAQVGSWTIKAPMPTDRTLLAVEPVNGLIYAFGGETFVEPGITIIHDKLEVYDPATDTWATMAPMPAPRKSVASAVVNGKIYVIGGQASRFGAGQNSVFEYDVATDTWSIKSPMPTVRFGAAAGVINGIIYVVGGRTSNTTRDVVEAYDPVTDTWSTRTPMLAGRYFLDAEAVGGVLYAMGGVGSSNRNEAYDPTTDTWTSKATMPTGREFLAVAKSFDLLYAIAGRKRADGVAIETNIVETYDPSTDSWSTVEPLPSGNRSNLKAATVNGVIYALGGDRGAGAESLATNEAFTPPTPDLTALTPIIDTSLCTPIGIQGGCTDCLEAFEFTVSEAIEARALGVFDGTFNGPGLDNPHDLGLFTIDGTLLASVTIPSGEEGTLVGGFRWVPLSSPVTLEPDVNYVVVAAFGPPGNSDLLLDTFPCFQFADGITFVRGRRIFGSHTLSVPPPGTLLVGPNILLAPINQPPIAEAGRNQAIHAGQTVFLDGSGSFDDNTPSEDLTYAWSVTKPDSTLLTLTGPTPSFIADLEGDYQVLLVVTDAEGLVSAPDQVIISSLNAPPIAEAGPENLGAYVGELVTLDGSASIDPDGDPIQFFWDLGNGQTAASEVVQVAYNAPGTFQATLLVRDQFGAAAQDTVTITVITGEDFAEMQAMETINTVGTLAETSVTTVGNQTALGNFMKQVVAALQEGDTAEAKKKLQDAILRTDGCALRGSPDLTGGGQIKKDYVNNCDDQALIYPVLVEALSALNGS